MEKMKFKTNIKCAACIEKVTPFLNEAVGNDNWSVDLNSPVKELSANVADENVVKKALEKAGYKAEKQS